MLTEASKPMRRRSAGVSRLRPLAVLSENCVSLGRDDANPETGPYSRSRSAAVMRLAGTGQRCNRSDAGWLARNISKPGDDDGQPKDDA